MLFLLPYPTNQMSTIYTLSPQHYYKTITNQKDYGLNAAYCVRRLGQNQFTSLIDPSKDKRAYMGLTNTHIEMTYANKTYVAFRRKYICAWWKS